MKLTIASHGAFSQIDRHRTGTKRITAPTLL